MMRNKIDFLNRINVRVLGMLLILFAVIAVTVSLINQNNIRRAYEGYFTQRVLLTNSLMAAEIESSDVSYFVELLKKQDDGFKSRQIQFYHDREELFKLQSSGASEEELSEIMMKLNEFHQETASLKNDRYWTIISQLQELKDTSSSTYVYVLADTGLVTEDGTKLFTFIFDAQDGEEFTGYDTDGLGTSTTGGDYLEIIIETGVQMDYVSYYDGDYGELYYAYAPIRDSDGNVIAVLGTDLELGNMHDMISTSSFTYNMVFLAFFSTTVIFIFIYLTFNVTKPLRSLTQTAYELTDGNRNTAVSQSVLRQRGEIGVLAYAMQAAIDENKRSVEHLEYTLNNVAAMICVTDPETNELLFVNDEMRRVCQVPEEYIGLKCHKVLQNLEEQCDFCPCPELDEKPDKEVIWEQRHKGLDRIYRSFSRYVKWPDGKTVHLQYSADITDMLKALDEAKSANMAKSAFLANMSHEIRTPMNAILGITEIELKKGTLPAETAQALGRIYESGDLLLSIINDILDFSKIEANKLEIIPVNYDLPDLINETVHLNLMRYDKGLIEFIPDIDENTLINLFGDKLRVKQILNNLISNALKYTDKGQVRLSVSTEDENEADKVILKIKITDTGRGMTAEQISKLFEEYTRFDMYVNRTIQGTGLGMCITKRLVELMGGEISVDSAVNAGSVFTVTLPQRRVNNFICGREISEQLRSFTYRKTAAVGNGHDGQEKMTNGSVLIVDDMESNIYVTRGMLAPYGLKIDTAKSGIEAIEKVEGGKVYDIIFMDYMMPNMNGIEATKILREMGYKNAISALTANALTGQAEIFMENGFDAFLSKPIDSRELKAVLERFISNIEIQ